MNDPLTTMLSPQEPQTLWKTGEKVVVPTGFEPVFQSRPCFRHGLQ